jgi:glycosyltransferase involved in cell wall biosynthesis
MDTAPRYSVVIPAYNEECELPQTLAALQCAVENYRASGGRGEFEFIVVDNASTDGTARVAAQWGARVIHEPFRQIARARNCGARAATGEILITCDADSRCHVRTFREIEHRFSPRVLAAGVTVQAADRRVCFWLFYFVVNVVSVLCRLPAGMYIVRRSDFWDLGGFDETRFALEDVDFARRLRARARALRRRIVIFTRIPILTSTRKLRMVPLARVFKLAVLAVLRPRKYLSRREYWESLFYGEGLRDHCPVVQP